MTDVSNEKTLERFSDPDVSFRHLRLCWGLRRIPTSAESQVTTFRSRFGIPGHGSTTPHHRDIPHHTSKKKNHDDFCRLFLSSHDILYTPSHNNCNNNNNRQQQQQLNGFQRFRGAGKEKKRKANIKECRGYPV